MLKRNAPQNWLLAPCLLLAVASASSASERIDAPGPEYRAMRESATRHAAIPTKTPSRPLLLERPPSQEPFAIRLQLGIRVTTAPRFVAPLWDR